MELSFSKTNIFIEVDMNQNCQTHIQDIDMNRKGGVINFFDPSRGGVGNFLTPGEGGSKIFERVEPKNCRPPPNP